MLGRSVQVSRRNLIAGAASALTFAVVKAPAKAAQFELKIADHLAVNHPLSVRGKQMWNAIENESGGRIRAQFFANGLLGSNAAQFGQLRVGALHFLLLNPGDVSAVVPSAGITFLGFAFKDADEALRAHDGPLGAYICKEGLSKNLNIFRSIWDSGMIQVTSSKGPIRTPDDFRGLKIRVNESKITVDLFRALGANPTPLDAGVYTALQTRVVDADMEPLNTVQTNRLFEVQKYISLTNHQWSAAWLIANGDTWRSLPPDLQQIIERNNVKYTALQRRDTKLVNASVANQLSREGVAINTPDQAPFRAMLRSYYQEWATEYGATEWGALEASLGRRLT